jgi:hypothetical protein
MPNARNQGTAHIAISLAILSGRAVPPTTATPCRWLRIAISRTVAGDLYRFGSGNMCPLVDKEIDASCTLK